MDDGTMDLQKGSSDKKSAMTDSSTSCVVCDRTSDLVCKKCKTEVYCSPECQLQHWKVHKPHCKRKELRGAPCDVCGDTEDGIDRCCCECGFLFCESCVDRTTVSSATCPRCEKSMGHQDYPEAIEKLLERVKESSDDPRLAQWLVLLGWFFKNLGSDDGEQNTMKYYKRAGKLGLGEGYGRLGHIYILKQNWKNAMRYCRKGAELHDVSAIYMMGTEAYNGFIDPQQERKRDPDPKEAFRWFQIGAQLCDPSCCMDLGGCYTEGIGTEQNLVKAFKWTKRAAEMGNPEAMRRCGICFRLGEGVEQSNEHAIYWFKKSLEQEENAETRSILHNLYNL